MPVAAPPIESAEQFLGAKSQPRELVRALRRRIAADPVAIDDIDLTAVEACDRVVRPNGELRIVHSQGDLTRDASGRPRSLFGTIQDITERKRAEEALREVQMELTHANRVTTIGQLTASVAHEVNQPIAAAVTNAQAALRWLGAQPPDLEEVRRPSAGSSRTEDGPATSSAGSVP